jgi:glucosamine-phosphate N-acetyltransferase
MILEKLQKKHYFTSIFELLGEYHPIEKSITYSEFETWFDSLPFNQHIYILQDDFRNIVGLGTLLIESKIFKNFSKVGYIKDIIILKRKKNKGYGKFLVQYLINIAKNNFNVNKVILNCSEKYIKFYETCGFTKKNFQMIKNFFD